MTLTAPNLTTTIGRTTYETDINANFALQQTFNEQVAAEVAARAPDYTSLLNYGFLTRQMGTDGILGVDSFVPSFSGLYDTITIAVPTYGSSACVIGGQLHTYASAFSQSLAGLGGSPYNRVIIGANSLGQPTMELEVKASASEDLDDVDLLLWSFRLTYVGGLYSVTRLVREATVLSNRDAFEKAVLAEIPIVADQEGNIPVVTGELPQAGIIVPWDCEILRAYARVRVAPGAGTSISLNVRNGSTALLTAASITSSDAGVVKTLASATPVSQLAAGTWIRPYATNTGDPSAASDLDITYVFRRTFHTIY